MNSTSISTPTPRRFTTHLARIRDVVSLAAVVPALVPGPLMPSARAQEPPTYYVNVANPTPVLPYTSWNTAATNIQDAVNAGTEPGRLVLVTNGVYETGTVVAYGTNRVALTNAVLRSVNGPAVTIIDGSGSVRGGYVGTNAVLSGFTLQNGRAVGDWASVGRGGGVVAEDSGVVTNCLLKANTATTGGGVAGGRLYRCTLTGNSASWGGGASGGTLSNCLLTFNEAYGLPGSGGAARATLYNCTVTGNSGGGIYGGAVYNSILYFNQGENWYAYEEDHVSLEYSCTTPLPPGPGNISAEPGLASASHLSAASPCIGAGNPAWASGLDIDGEPWASPPAIGADQVWPGQSLGSIQMHITSTFRHAVIGIPFPLAGDSTGPILGSVWDFGDGTTITNQPFVSHAWAAPGKYTVRLTGYNDAVRDGAATTLVIQVGLGQYFVDVNSMTPSFPYATWETAARTLREAVEAEPAPGRIIWVTNGVYGLGSVESNGPNRVAVTNATLRSVNGPQATIIDGIGAARCVYLGADAILSGFTLRNGWGGGVVAVASGVVTNCVVTANSGNGAAGGLLRNCILSANSGAGASGATLHNCVLTGNSGGGANQSVLYNCTVTGNSSMPGFLWFPGAVFTGESPIEGYADLGDVGGVWDAALYNCIVHSNEGRNWAYAEFDHSCTTPPAIGPGNIPDDPLLASTGHVYPFSPCLGAGNRAYASGEDIDGEAWADPPPIGADQVWPGQVFGSLTMEITAELTEVGANYPVLLAAGNTGRVLGCVWDFGDGATATNLPVVAHAWAAPGTYTVRLTGYNDSHPEGVSASLAIEVLEAVHYVNADNPTPVFPFTSWETAATNIQDAINAGTVTGYNVVVTNGVYGSGIVLANGTNRVALTNALLRSVNGPDVTIIDGGDTLRCAYLGANAILSGFTLRSGYAGLDRGGGVLSEPSGVVTNCMLSGNRADASTTKVCCGREWCSSCPSPGGVGGGASGGSLHNCTLTGNSAWRGGGASGSRLHDCTVAGNSALGLASEGGGVLDSVLENCTLSHNSAQRNGGGALGSTLYNCRLNANYLEWANGPGDNSWPPMFGGGAYGCALYNCALTANSAIWAGGGACKSTLYNCTLTANSAIWAGGGAFRSTLYNCTLVDNSGGGASGGTLDNCTVTGNSPSRAVGGSPPRVGPVATDVGGVQGSTLHNCIVYSNQGRNWADAVFEYSCTTPLPPGPGNIEADPMFASTTHLSSSSPCLAAGSRAYASGVDIDGEAWADPPAMGADQPWPERSLGPLSLDILASQSQVVASFPLCFTAGNAGLILYSVWDFGDGTTVTNQAFVQYAWSTPGEYTVKLTGFNHSHPEGASSSLPVKVVTAVHRYVNAANANPVFPYASWETAATGIQEAINASDVPGTTVHVTNRVYAGPVAVTNVALQSVNGPQATAIDGDWRVQCVRLQGGAMLSGFTLRNGVAERGGGVEAVVSGGFEPVITNCMLTDNGAGSGGGAFGGKLYDCTLTGNGAGSGGGAFGGKLYNCTLTGNWADSGGGASGSALYNCVLTGNSGGGVLESTLQNCIAYFNDSNWDRCTFEYSCTTPLAPGPGNLEADPRFVNYEAGDFWLRPDSPCIDAGTNLTEMLTTDFLGLPRPLDGNGDGVARFDMGAYEFNPYRFGLVLRPGPDGFHFTIRGEPGKTVRVERSRDFQQWEAVTTVPLPASGQALLDPAAITEQMLFYRAVAEP